MASLKNGELRIFTFSILLDNCDNFYNIYLCCHISLNSFFKLGNDQNKIVKLKKTTNQSRQLTLFYLSLLSKCGLIYFI